MTAKHRRRKLERALKRRETKSPNTKAIEVVKARAHHLAGATHMPFR